MRRKPVIAVSQCLLGEPVRYDGTDKNATALVETLERAVRFIPICPEVEAGFGVPRPPMRVEKAEDEAKRLIVIESRRDQTDAMNSYAGRKVKELYEGGIDGMVLKARSPSCGKASGLYSKRGDLVGTTPGFFVMEVRNVAPRLPIADEDELSDAAAIMTFLERVHQYAAQRLGTSIGRR